MKPDVSIILKPVLDRIYSLSTEGIQITTPIGPKNLKARLLACVCDLPAKAMTLNFNQWNGEYGCNNCLDFGVTVSHRRLYLPGEKHDLRSEQDVSKCVRETAHTNRPVHGVKGPSVLTPFLNIVKDVPIDYMHAVLEGVTRTLICKMWMDGRHHNLRFYLSKEVKQINKLLLAIKPPHEFRRSPRCIKTVKYWKASELRAFLLYYAIPILVEFLPADYIHHLNLLVKAIHILLSSAIPSAALHNAKRMLSAFYRIIPLLYPLELCTMNVHSLIHLCDSVQRCGPLWSTSCFGYESMNGHLKKHCHGTGNVLPQLIRNVRFHQKISEQKRSMSSIDGVRGRIKHKLLPTEHISALQAGLFPISSSSVPVFSRYKLNGVVYQVWNNNRLRNSSTCKFKRANGMTAYGSIRCFCLCGKQPIAIIATFSSVKDAFESLRRASIAELNSYSMVNSCIYSAEKLSTSLNLHAVLVSSIMTKCVHIPSNSCDYIVPFPNTYEHH